MAQCREVLEREGFECALSYTRTFADHPAATFVFCDRLAGFLVSRRWQVALVQTDEGTLLDVWVTTGLTGP